MKCRIFCLFIFILFFATAADAQFPMSEGPTRERARDENERDLEERIAYQRMLSTIAEKHRAKRQPKLVLAELQEDFKQIQAVNLEMVRSLSKPGDPDFKFAADTVAEIKKRAARLKVNLVLPEPEKAETQPSAGVIAATAPQLKRSMLDLGKLIYSFVKNPFFTQLDVINQESAVKVRRQLDEIIARSEEIKKSSDNLKTAQNHSKYPTKN